MLDYASTRIEQGNKSEHKLYEFINKNPNLTEYELCKKLKWSCGKVYNSMRRLEEKGLVKKKVREVKKIYQYYPTPWKEILRDVRN